MFFGHFPQSNFPGKASLKTFGFNSPNSLNSLKTFGFNSLNSLNSLKTFGFNSLNSLP